MAVGRKSAAVGEPAHAATPRVKITRRAAERLRSGHVWVYRSDLIASQDVPPGSVVAVESERGRLLGSALYSSASQIALRMIARSAIDDDAEMVVLLQQRVREAIAYRQRVVPSDAEAYRVIFSEADGLPGLIVDRYRQIISLQALTQAMDRANIKEAIVSELLKQLPGVCSVVERVEP